MTHSVSNVNGPGQGLHRHADSLAAGNILIHHYEQPIAHQVDVHDESLRDGEQTVGLAFSLERKLEIARGLLDAGVRYMSLGYPAVSEGEREIIRSIAKLADPSGFSCLSRATRHDVEAVVACGVPNIGLFIGVSDVHLNTKLRIDEAQAYTTMCEQLKLARSYGLRPRFALEDATRAPLARLKRFALGAVEAGATMLTIPDTCGVLTPLTTYRLIQELTATVGGDKLAVHFHNDLGMATANSLTAVTAGARFVQGTLCGIGERAGNANLEQVVVGLKVKYAVDVGIELQKLSVLSGRMAQWVHLNVPPTQPISGEYVFSHESGIHVHGILQDVACYEPFPPELVGRQHEVRYGKHSGLSNLKYLSRLLELDVSDERLTGILIRVKQRAEQGRSTTGSEVEEMLREARG